MTEPLSVWSDTTSYAEAIFIARDGMEELSGNRHEPEITTVSFHDLYHYATNGDVQPNPILELALMTNERARADLHLLLSRTTPLRTLSRAAASSGAITTRQGSGFQMTLRESRADQDQVYLTIRLGDFSSPAPTTLFVLDDGLGCRKVPLPAASDGVIQMLLDVTSDLAAALCDPKADVFLR